MGKEDKQFFTGLISNLKTDLENQIGSVKTDLENQIGSVKTDLENQIGSVKSDLENQIGSVKSDLESQICRNGILIEEIQSDFRAFGERQDLMDDRLKTVETGVKEIKENTRDLPVIRQTVASHSTAILELSK